MRVSVLGQLTVTGEDGVRLAAEELPRRARQVLAVLASRYGRIQSKDALADAVWGDQLPGNHVAALEHYVSVIRRRFQPMGGPSNWFIVTRGGGYLFDTTRAGLDLADLRCRLDSLDALAAVAPERQAMHEEILGLAKELPFPEDPYADWAESVRNEVRVAAVNSLLALASAALATDAPRSLRMAQQAIELDPFLEPAYEAAMRAAAKLGRPDDALRLFERCKRSLDTELGVEPSADLVRLQRTILSSRHEPAEPEPKPVPLRLVPPVPPRRAAVIPERFVGRSAEITLLLDTDPTPVVHVVGPFGSGKSAFLDELGRHAPGRVGIGYGATSHGGLRLTWLRSALSGLGADPEVVAAAAAEEPLGRDRLELIATAFAGPEPVFLAIDEAGELDATSVAELAWLSRHCPDLRIVLTYCYPSQITGRPVAALGTPVVLRLGTLTGEELEAFGDDTLLDRTGGIPALVAVARRPVGIAESVAMEVARQRTRWMPAPAWEILRLCAALGSLRVSELVTLAGRPMSEVLAAVDCLVHAQLLAEGPGGHVRHRSSMIGDAIAEQVSSASGQHLREVLAGAS